MPTPAEIASCRPPDVPDLGYAPVPDIFKLPEGLSFGPCSGVAVTAAGNLLVFNRGEHALLEFDADGTFIKTWGGEGTGPGQFNVPHSIVVDPDGLLHVADTLNWRVQKLVKHS